MRSATIARKTAETDISLTLTLDGEGKYDIESSVGFLDHMLSLFAKHAGFDLTLRATGDTAVDDHHTVEDIGICLGRALREAVGEGRGISRYGQMILPMDEALILTAVDVGGRAYLAFDCPIPTEKVGSFDTELVEEFMAAFVREARINLHIRRLSGTNSHHIIEGVFKSLARSLRAALSTDPRLGDALLSTKGVLL